MDETTKRIVLPLKEKKVDTDANINTEENETTNKDDSEELVKFIFLMPSGKTETIYEKMSTQVGYFKVVFSEKFNIPYKNINLLYNKKSMLDPLSIIDIIKEDLKTIEIEVQFSE